VNAYDLAVTIYSHPLARTVLGLMAANILVGLASSLYFRDFRLGALADWLMSRAIPYLIGAGAVQLVLMAVPSEHSGLAQGAGTVVWLFVVGSLVGKILDTLREMGMPVPVVLTDKSKPDATATP
jgi:hypothetical protein